MNCPLHNDLPSVDIFRANRADNRESGGRFCRPCAGCGRDLGSKPKDMGGKERVNRNSRGSELGGYILAPDNVKCPTVASAFLPPTSTSKDSPRLNNRRNLCEKSTDTAGRARREHPVLPGKPSPLAFLRSCQTQVEPYYASTDQSSSVSGGRCQKKRKFTHGQKKSCLPLTPEHTKGQSGSWCAEGKKPHSIRYLSFMGG